MAHIRADRVQETSTFTGTGAVTLGTVPARMRAFNAVMANGDTTFVLIEHATAAEWELCLATWNTGNSLSRGAVVASSTGSAVSFSAGTKTVSIVAVAAKLVVEDNSGDADVERDFDVGRDIDIVRNALVGGTLGVTGRLTASEAIDETQASSMASASSMNIAAANGNYIAVTGTTTITAFTTALAGVRRKLKFAGILTLTHDATSFINLTGANITTAAGDIAEFVSEGSGHWRMTGYERASGAPLVLTSALITAALTYTPENAANRGSANGYAPLGSDSLIPTAYLPPLAINEVFTAASQAAMLALTAQRGDVCARSDTSLYYILSSDSPSTLADWKLFTATGVISSVAGRTGAVVITSSDLADFNTAVRTNRLDQMAAPGANVPMATYRITGLGDPSGAQDGATKAYVDARIGLPQGRLTLTSATPVLSATVSAATTIYYALYLGNQIPIYDGSSAFVSTTFAELTNATAQSSTGKAGPAAVANNSNYDLFVWSDSGTLRLTRGPAWTSDTGRGTGAGTTELQRISGIWTNKVAITNGPGVNLGTYVGTVRSNGSAQIDWIVGGFASGGTAAVLGVWNAYNRRPVRGLVGDTTASWNYTTATWRAADASSTMRCSFVSGLAEDPIVFEYIACCFNTTASVDMHAGIGYDSTSAFSGVATFAGSNSSFGTPIGKYAKQDLGFHFGQALEYSTASGTSTWYGNIGSQMQSGLSYAWEC